MAKFYDKHRPRSARKRYSGYKPRSQRGVSPVVPVFIIVLVMIVAGSAVYYLPKLHKRIKNITADNAPLQTSVPAQHPLETISVGDITKGIDVTDSAYKWFSDCSVYGDTAIFCAGEVVGGDAVMTSLMQCSVANMQDTVAQRINILLENECVMYPVFNEKYLVYLDANESGGGKIMCCKFGGDYTKTTMVKEVYTGHPVLCLSGDILAWTERTGTSMDKLFVCDLTTLESATVQTFDRMTCYGVSRPNLKGANLMWADVDSETTSGVMTSQICMLNVETGEYFAYKPEMYVHDPKSNGNGVVAWITGNHGTDSDLYFTTDFENNVLVEKGVVDFYIDKDYIAYQKNEAIHVYIISEGKSFTITRGTENAQLMGVFGNTVIWNNIASGDRETLKFSKIPE